MINSIDASHIPTAKAIEQKLHVKMMSSIMCFFILIASFDMFSNYIISHPFQKVKDDLIFLKPPCVILTYHLCEAKISSSERISSDRVGFIPPLADFIAKLYSVRLRIASAIQST